MPDQRIKSLFGALSSDKNQQKQKTMDDKSPKIPNKEMEQDNDKADERDINWTNAMELWERGIKFDRTQDLEEGPERERRLATVVTKRKKEETSCS